MAGTPWTEQELIPVLALYHQLPFGKMDRTNPAVIQLANSLHRTPSSIALKLVNFASFDPALQARGIRGMANTSRLDRQVWDQFHDNWPTLASDQAAQHAATSQWQGRPTAAQRTVTVRIGQGFFRNAVLSAYDGQCCITRIAEPALLRASHIVPWSTSEQRRLRSEE